MGKIWQDGKLEFENFDDSDEDYQRWLDKEYKYWKGEEAAGFSSIGEYWDWVRRGAELDFLIEVENTGEYYEQ